MNRSAARLIDRRLRDSKHGICRRHIKAGGCCKACMAWKVSSFMGRQEAQPLFCELYVMLEHLIIATSGVASCTCKGILPLRSKQSCG